MVNSNAEDGGATARSPTILLVEDNPGDARLVEEAFSDDLADAIHVVSTGEEALDFVNQHEEYRESPEPDLILLDWHLPETDGPEVLAELNADEDHNHIPVIVLTGSQSETEIRESYKQNANACLSKQASPDDLEEALRAFEEFWFSAARLPCAQDEGE